MSIAMTDDIGIEVAAVPEESEIEQDESVTEQESGKPPEKDEDPFKKTYLAIDGIEHADISEADKERLERHVIEFMLHNGYPISGVRILSEETNVIELDREE